MIRILTCLLLIFCLTSVSINAADVYVKAGATSGPLCSPKWGQFSTNVFKRQGTSNAGVPACSSRAGKPELLLRKATSVKT